MNDSLLLSKCEQKKLFKRDGVKSYEWTEVNVASIPPGTDAEIRCLYCHGRVRIHRQHVDHGPSDHVEHRSKQDSTYCRAGHDFQGEHRMSKAPVI